MAGTLLLTLFATHQGCTRSDDPFDGSSGTRWPEVFHFPQYLVFQIFVGSSDPSRPIGEFDVLLPPPPKAVISGAVQDIVHRIGSKGVFDRRLGVAIGPLGLDHTDDELRRVIRDSFETAIEEDVAVAFHIDESMYWKKRKDLWSNPLNIERHGWNGAPSLGRKVGWIGPRLAPQMCLNSTVIRAEARRLATDVIGREVRAGIDRLRTIGKEILFAGVIVGWETQIGTDSEGGPTLGYCALANRGWSATELPPDSDRELEEVVREYITLWARGLVAAGLPEDRIYSHIAFVPRAVYEMIKRRDPARVGGGTYSQFLGFAPRSVSFGDAHRPGFSTYPHPGLWEDLYEALAQHGNPNWASAEGTALNMPMETYLARAFNHGATLVNIFAWGIGGPALKNDRFRVATEGEESIRTYRRFLNGESLTDGASSGLAGKIKRIQTEVPPWVRRTGKLSQVEPLLHRLHTFLGQEKLGEAEKVADEILSLIGGKSN